jgi:hypothetical protein
MARARSASFFSVAAGWITQSGLPLSVTWTLWPPRVKRFTLRGSRSSLRNGIVFTLSDSTASQQRYQRKHFSFLLQLPLSFSILPATISWHYMKPTLLPVLLAATALTLISCSSTTYKAIDENTPGATFEKGVPGGTLVETHKVTATVSEIDAPSRKVTLVEKNGQKTTVKCGPEVINFDQIRVGDVVKATVTAELTVAMADAATTPGDSGATVVALSPKGARPGVLTAETQRYTATITAINLKRRQATLRFPDGTSRTFAVRKDVDLTQRKVGEEVVFRVTVAMALSVEKP